MDASENDRYALFSIGISDLVGPQSRLGQNGDPNEVHVLQRLFKIDRREEIIGERDFYIGWGEGSKNGKSEVINSSVFFNSRRNELNLHTEIVTTFIEIVKTKNSWNPSFHVPVGLSFVLQIEVRRRKMETGGADYDHWRWIGRM
jgi:hypothetical protein